MTSFPRLVLFWALELMLLMQAATHGPEPEGLSFERSNLVYVRNRAGDRRLQESEEWAPMRIHVFTDELRSDMRRSQNVLRYLVDDLIPAGTRWLSETLRVRPVQGNLFFQQACQSAYSDGTCQSIHPYTFRCGLASISEAALAPREFCRTSRSDCQISPGGEGIANADFAFYVTAKADGCESGAAAYASPCRFDSNDRPIGGFMNVCQLTGRVSEDIGLFIHETLHGLGFGDTMFAFFRYDDGTPRTPRDWNGLPPVSNRRYIASPNTVARVQQDDGSIKHFIVLPRAIQEAREHFACPQLERVPLEEAGGDGTSYSHWDSRAMHTELMGPQVTFYPKMSKITLAVLEDSGWYKPVYANAGRIDYGHGQGCEFLTESCVQQGQTQFPDTFCTEGPVQSCARMTVLEIGCLHNLMGKAVCNRCLHSTPLPRRFQYFSDPRLGGRDPFFSYCPVWVPFMMQGGSSFCTDSLSDRTSQVVRGESFGAASRCVMSTVTSARFEPGGLAGTCYQTRCNTTGLEIQVGDQWIFCGLESEGRQVPVGDGWLGYVVCPAHRSLCRGRTGEHGGDIPCKFPSDLQYGRCVCAPGYLNEDCAIEDTQSNRAEYPYAFQYRNNEIVIEVGQPVQLETRPTIQGNLDGLHYSVSPALPSGLSISRSEGTLAGSVRAPAERAPYTVRAKSGQGAATATLFITAVVSAGTRTSEPPETTMVPMTSAIATTTGPTPITTVTPVTSARATTTQPPPTTTVTPMTSARATTTEPPRTTEVTTTSSEEAAPVEFTTTAQMPGSSASTAQTTEMTTPTIATTTIATQMSNGGRPSSPNMQAEEEGEDASVAVIIGAAAGGAAATALIVLATLLLYFKYKKSATPAPESKAQPLTAISDDKVQMQMAHAEWKSSLDNAPIGNSHLNPHPNSDQEAATNLVLRDEHPAIRALQESGDEARGNALQVDVKEINVEIDQPYRPDRLSDDQWQALQKMLDMDYDFDTAGKALERNAWDVKRAILDLLERSPVNVLSV